MTLTKYEAELERRQYAVLTSHYRAIGPAAIVAALLHTSKSKASKTAK